LEQQPASSVQSKIASPHHSGTSRKWLATCARGKYLRFLETARQSNSGTLPAQFAPAVKVIIFISLNVFGALGWWAGERFGIMTAWFLGGIGSVAGVYIGWLVARRYLE